MKTVLAALIGLLILFSGSTGLAQLTPSYDWQVMETDHFRIVFHPEVEGLAAEAAVAAEDAYQRWSVELNTVPPAKTDIVVIDFDDSPNGFADTYNLHSWEFVSQIQFGVFFGGRMPSNMADTVYHEYWHIADINHTNGISALLRNVFGRIVMPNDLKPWFAIEGSATYSEFLIYNYSRASAALSRMYLQQLALDNNFPPLDRAAHSFSNVGWPTSGTLAYIMGSWFVRYVEETYGRGTLAKFDDLLADNWLAALAEVLNSLIADRFGVGVYLGPDFASIMEQATDVSADELYQGFQGWLREQALVYVARVQAQGPTVSSKLTDFGYWTGQPKWSPTGEWIAYEHSSPFRRDGIRLIRPDGTQEHALTPATFIFDHAFSWSADGNWLVYSEYDQFGPYLNVNDLYLADAQTGAAQRLSWGLRAFNPVFTPDGQGVYFAQNVGGDRSPRISYLELATGAVSVIHEFPDDTFVDFFALSPDGAQLALSIWKRPGFSDLYLLSLEDRSLRPLTQDMEEDYRPAWSPDGKYVLFDSIRDETFNLHAVRVSDGAFFRITNATSGAFSPTASPDGAQVAFIGYSGSGYDLHVMPYDPSQWKAVDFAPQTIPAWEGYPPLEFEVKPYNPVDTMLPKYWLPVVRDTQAGIYTDAWDALYRQYYSIEAVYDWDAQAPLGTVVYVNQQHLSPVEFSLAGGLTPWGDWQSLAFSYSLINQFYLQHALSLSLDRGNFDGETYTLSGGWDYFQRFGKDLFWNDVTFSVSDALTYDVAAADWLLDLVFDLRNRAHLAIVDAKGPHELATKLTVGWSDTAESFALGGSRGAFLVRGQPRGVATGSQIVAASAEYRFPILSIERGMGLGPLFLDDVRAALFLDAGAAGEGFNPAAPLTDDLALGYGVELQMSLTTGYFPRRLIVLGVANGVGQGQPEFYFSFATAF